MFTSIQNLHQGTSTGRTFFHGKSPGSRRQQRFSLPANPDAVMALIIQQQCDAVMAPILQAGLPCSGIVRTFPCALVFGPIEYQGLVIPNLYTSQGIANIKRILKYRLSTTISPGNKSFGCIGNNSSSRCGSRALNRLSYLVETTTRCSYPTLRKFEAANPTESTHAAFSSKSLRSQISQQATTARSQRSPRLHGTVNDLLPMATLRAYQPFRVGYSGEEP